MRIKTIYPAILLLLCLFLAVATTSLMYFTEVTKEPCLQDILTVKVNAPGYTIIGPVEDDQRDQGTHMCTPVRKATDEFECKMWLGLERKGGEVPEIGGRGCDDFEMVFFKEGLPCAGDWAVDEVKSSPCAELFRYTGTTTSITLTVKETAANERPVTQRIDGWIGGV